MADIDGRNAQRAITAPLSNVRSATGPSTLSPRSGAAARSPQILLARAGLGDAFAEVFASISNTNTSVRNSASSASEGSSRDDESLNETGRRSDTEHATDDPSHHDVAEGSGDAPTHGYADKQRQLRADQASLASAEGDLTHPASEVVPSSADDPDAEPGFNPTVTPMNQAELGGSPDVRTATAGRSEARESTPPSNASGLHDLQGRAASATPSPNARPNGDALNALPSADQQSADQQLASGEREANSAARSAAANSDGGESDSQPGRDGRRRKSVRNGKLAVETSADGFARHDANRALNAASGEAPSTAENSVGFTAPSRPLATNQAAAMNAAITGDSSAKKMTALSTPLASAQKATASSVRGETTASSNAASRLPLLAGPPAASAPRNAASASPQGGSPGSRSEAVSRVQLIQRVSNAFQHLGRDGGTIRLRLAPAELGSVRIEMQVTEQKVRARVVAETEAASSLLREHLPDLRARLESYGMKIEHFDVETEQSETSFDKHHDDSSRSHSDQQRRGAQRSFTKSETELHDSEARASHDDTRIFRSTTTDQRVDIRL